MIHIINYGLGNVRAFQNIYERLQVPVKVVSSAEELASASHLILPGVGSFDWAMSRLNESGMRDLIDELVLVKQIPILGVCVGMQMMARHSEEGKEPGLGWVEAGVKKLTQRRGLPLPHMGWNEIRPSTNHPLFEGLLDPQFYFLHSFVVVPEEDSLAVAETDYGIPFTAAVAFQNILGVQFHPEKSHHWGVKLLENFAKY